MDKLFERQLQNKINKQWYHCRKWLQTKFKTFFRNNTVGILNPTIWNPDFLKVRFDDPVFKWLGFNYGYSYSTNHLKTRTFEIWTFLSRFQMVLDKMTAICPDFKWLGFRISDHIWNLIQTRSDFRSPL